ncbi:hypothetical protein MKQ68_21085 [Chitinophaga horti]|uniref:DUF3575 domain-containing protein n=1 Tax=Chitinophaga horti TaxID=2920382 RepID=A0ABY6J335_9BACT|nr:hypothetical protein [Chitinophaga horti]UYQ92582.1 hypothetical protein MKQ68_21085 [Chitinophaga horti]
MKRVLLILMLASCTSLTLRAQDKARQPKDLRTFIKINPTSFISSLDLTVEQMLSDKLSIELGVMGIYTDYPDYLLAKRIDLGQKKPRISTTQFVEAQGLGFRAGMRWYLGRESGVLHAQGTYFQPMLFYKKIFYPKENFIINDVTYTGDGTKNVYGVQMLMGRQFSRGHFVMDPYLGIGLRTKVYDYLVYDEKNGVATPDNGRLVQVLPSLHLGIKIGLGF